MLQTFNKKHIFHTIESLKLFKPTVLNQLADSVKMRDYYRLSPSIIFWLNWCHLMSLKTSAQSFKHSL